MNSLSIFTRNSTVLLFFCLIPMHMALADQITSLTVHPNPAKVGELVRFTAEISDVKNGECGITLKSMSDRNLHITVGKYTKLPIVWTARYRQTGTYNASLEGHKKGSTPSCTGGDKLVFVDVQPATTYGKVSSSCPEGWKLHSYRKKKRSFTCKPATRLASAELPKEPIVCPKDRKYFARKSSLGCR